MNITLAESLLNQIYFSLIEGLETDHVEQWTKVVSVLKRKIIPKLKELQASKDMKEYRLAYAEIIKFFSEIADLMRLDALSTELEGFARSVKISKPKMLDTPDLSGSIASYIKKIQTELISGKPSKYNVFLAMRLINDIGKILFMNRAGLPAEKKLFNKAIKLQTIYDSSLMKLFNKRLKKDF